LISEQPPRRRFIEFVLVTIAFGLAYTQLPLYSSNQNHHFLTGLAQAGFGWIGDDWLTATADPFPVFSAGVRFAYRYLGEWSFYAAYQALIAAYIWSVLGIVGELVPACRRLSARLATLAVLTVLHSEVVGYLIGFDARHMYWWQMFTWGVAEQEIFGHAMFQGSAIGLLLPGAVLLFLRGRPTAAVVLTAAVVTVHPSYGVTAAALVVGHALYARFHGGTWRRVAARLLLFGVLVSPVVADVVVRFGATTTQDWQQASAILIAHLPVETMPERWLGLKAWLQVGFVAGALCSMRRSQLLYLLGPAFLAGVTLTGAQIATGNPGLALLFPWRVSVLLVPLATAVWTGRVVGGVMQWRGWLVHPIERRVVWIAGVAMCALAIGGAAKMTLHFSYFYGVSSITQIADRALAPAHIRGFSHELRTDALGAFAYVRRTRQRGDTYLIPLDLERFRLATGTPAYVDLKSHPYKDVEVIAWWRRIEAARRIQAASPDCEALEDLHRAGEATHVLAARGSGLESCPTLTPVFLDDHFGVWRIGDFETSTMIKRLGASGPTRFALSSREPALSGGQGRTR